MSVEKVADFVDIRHWANNTFNTALLDSATLSAETYIFL